MVDTSRTMSTPGVSTGTMIIDEPEYGCTSGLVTAITIRKSATDPLDVNHLCPLMTHSSPSRTAEVLQQRRIRSRRIGLGHGEGRTQLPIQQAAATTAPAAPRSPIASIPTASNSAFPESGALLPNTTGASGDCPRISCISPNFTCPNPMPPNAGGRCAAHSPCGLDLLLERPDQHPHLVVGQIQRLEREHLLPHEAAHPLQLLLELRFRREIPGHDHSSQRAGQLPAAHTLPLPWAP